MEEKIKVFLDSNILFSIAYSGREKSRAYLIYEIQDLKLIEIYISNLVRKEAVFNIINKKKDGALLLNELIRKSKTLNDISVDAMPYGIERLPLNDRIILSTAVLNEMDYFITGNDKDFKSFYGRKIRNTFILKPMDFLMRRIGLF